MSDEKQAEEKGGEEKMIDGAHMRKVCPRQSVLADFRGNVESSEEKMFPLWAVAFKSYLRRR